MFAALIFVMSAVALGQFGVWYWRSLLATVAAESLVQQMRGAGVPGQELRGDEFQVIASLHKLCPDLEPEANREGLVQVYYRLINGLRSVADARVPKLAAWAQAEMATCSRYMAVRLDQRIARTVACAESVHSTY